MSQTSDPAAFSDADPAPDGGEMREYAADGYAADDVVGDFSEDESMDSVEALRAELAQWKESALRARADLDNFRKRMTQEAAETRRYANASLLEELLPVVDNFQFGLQAAEADSAAKNLLIGLNMVAGQLQGFLRDQGVVEVAAVGEAFDPNVHEAVGQQASVEVPEGVVISQVRRGYKLRDRLLRPATVVVSTGPTAAADGTA